MTELYRKEILLESKRSEVLYLETHSRYDLDTLVLKLEELKESLIARVPADGEITVPPAVNFSGTIAADEIQAYFSVTYRESLAAAKKRVAQERAKAKKTAKKTQTLEEARNSKEFASFRKQFAKYRKLGIGIGEM